MKNCHVKPLRPSNVLNVNVESDADSERKEPEEARRVIVKSIENRPKQDEVDEHNVLHTPKADWCELCTKAKSVGSHRIEAVPKSERTEVVVQFDYTFWAKNLPSFQRR